MKKKMPAVSASILSADFMHLGEEIQAVDAAGADYIHIDVMDGNFVPNITFGSKMVESIRNVTKLPLDVHLMIAPVDPHLADFIHAGASIITIHPEAGPHLHRTLSQIRRLGAKSGVALNPATPVEMISSILSEIDVILIMTVNPGFGGQKFIPYLLNKIQKVQALVAQSGYDILIEVDGGVTGENAPEILAAGADILVAGTAIFSAQKNLYPLQIKKLKGLTHHSQDPI